MNRRHFLGLSSLTLLMTGCVNSPVGKTVATAFGRKTAAFSDDYPQQLPYASIAVSRTNMPKALLVLARADGDELHWISADRSVLVTRHGRLTRTVGLPTNILKTSPLHEDPLTKLGEKRGESIVNKRLLDLSPGDQYGIVIESIFTREKPEEITILRNRHTTTRFIERCHAPQLGWKFENFFWADEHGTVWRSFQHIAPDTPPIEIEVTKPYLG